MAKCPICDAEAAPRSVNPSFPFCTTRCKTIDLGKWMNEEYRIPVPDSELDEDDDAGASDGSSDATSKTPKDMRH